MLKLWYFQKDQRFNMAYIGRGTENISNVEVLDNLTFDGSASYTLQKSSTNFVPSSANNLLISISGVVQQGNFSVSGSTITFDTTVSASDTCDWILHYGTGLITTVADGAITEAKLGSNAVTTAKINNGAITSAKLDSGLALGKIGQVVQTTSTANQTTTSSSFVAVTGMSLSITPTSTSSKIYLTAMQTIGIALGGGYGERLSIFRNGSNLNGKDKGFGSWGTDASGTNATISMIYLDSPATTSAITYQVYFRSDGGATVNYNYFSGSTATLVAMEVLA